MACIDCGMKNNQSRILCQLGAKVTVFPRNHPVEQDGILFEKLNNNFYFLFTF
jgi:carbamoylphosphate synthase small subunit